MSGPDRAEPPGDEVSLHAEEVIGLERAEPDRKPFRPGWA